MYTSSHRVLIISQWRLIKPPIHTFIVCVAKRNEYCKNVMRLNALKFVKRSNLITKKSKFYVKRSTGYRIVYIVHCSVCTSQWTELILCTVQDIMYAV